MTANTEVVLTPKQEALAQACVQLGVGHQAYLEASPSARRWQPQSVDVKASQTLALDKVRIRISEIQDDRAERSGITTAMVLRALWDNYQKAIQLTPVLDDKSEPTGAYRYGSAIADRALELIGRHLCRFPTRSEVAGTFKHPVQASVDPKTLTIEQIKIILDGYRRAGVIEGAVVKVIEPLSGYSGE